MKIVHSLLRLRGEKDQHPIKQGLRHSRYIQRGKTHLIEKDQHPIKQGLRHSMFATLPAFCPEEKDQHPIKQGLRL